MNTNENLNIVIALISEVKDASRYIKKAKADKINFYKNNTSQLDSYEPEFIKRHNFKAEILHQAQELEKVEYFEKKIIKFCDGLELHKYSPEQNKLIFKGGIFATKTPHKETLADAVGYMVQAQSLEQLKQFNKELLNK